MRLIILSIVSSFILAANAHASLIGDTIEINWQNPSIGQFFSTDSVVVGAGAEVTCPDGGINLCDGFGQSAVSFDISASSISIEFIDVFFSEFGQDSYNGFIFDDLDWVGMIGEIVDVELVTNVQGLDLADVGFGSNFVSVDFGSNSGTVGSFTNGSFVTLNLITRHIVPEPSMLGLMGLSLIGMAALIRRKRS